MLDQKIVEEASAEWLLSEKGSEDPFIAGARWMEKYLEENKKRPSQEAPAGLFNEPLPGRVVRLTDPEFAPELAALKRRLADDPAFGRQLLKQAGIMNSKGKLAKSFGG